MVATLRTTEEHRKPAWLEHGAICRRFLAGLTLSMALLLTGCASIQQHSLTCKLWTDADFREFNEPASRPNLALYEATNHTEVLVQYDAFSEAQSTISRKAYFLRPDQAGSVTRQKPQFVKPSAAEGLKPIPIFPCAPDTTNALARPIPHAVAAPDSRNFTLYQHDGHGRSLSLPIYAEHSGTAARVALTPLVVGGDAVVVAAVVAVVVVIALCQGNESFTVH
jgi:hypothetical protein